MLKEGSDASTLSEDGTRELKLRWPVMEAFGALVFLLNQSRPPEQRSLHVRTGELQFAIGSNSGLLPPGILSLPLYLRSLSPPDMLPSSTSCGTTVHGSNMSTDLQSRRG